MESTQDNTEKYIVIGLLAAMFFVLAGAMYSEYLDFTLNKQKLEIIQTSIDLKLNAEQIQGLINSKN